MKKKLTLSLALATIMILFAGSVWATQHNVPAGGCIQDTIDIASPGDTINVAAGNYNENVNVDKQITLQGAGRDVVTVTAQNTGAHVFGVGANNVNISGFTVTGATGDWKAGIRLANGVQNCNIFNNTASNNYTGIYLYSSSNNALTGNIANSNTHYGIFLYISNNSNTLTGNTTNFNTSFGIYLWSSSNNTLTGNIANSNTHYGIYLYSSSDGNALTENTCNENTNNGIQLAYSSNNNTLTGNIANSNTGTYDYYGICLYSSSGNTLTENIANSNGYGIYLWFSSNNNTLTGNTTNLNTNKGIYVDDSSGNTLTGNTANSNNNIGIYLDGSSDNNLTGNTANSNTNEGIYLIESSNNTLTGNTANLNAYGIYLRGYSSSPSSNNTLTGNTVSSNTSYGIYVSCYSSGKVNCNNIVGNGGGVYNSGTGNPELDATQNWWGDASGPTHASNSGGTGDAVSDRVDYSPWLGSPYGTSATMYSDIKVWIEGAYSSGSMSTTLNANNYIPLTSPYSDELVVTSIPANVVDWVFVELRSTATGATYRYRSMFLESDGDIADPVYAHPGFAGTDTGNFYVVVRHRNHLAIMGGSAHTFVDAGSANLNLTNDSNVYGTNGVKELATGVYGMWAGDADDDEKILPTDKADWKTDFGVVSDGYHYTDMDLDGKVLPGDKAIWKSNFGIAPDSQVPSN